MRVGQNTNTPQATQQEKYQFRNDFSFSKAGWGGIGHDFKAGVNFINEPRLFLTFTEGVNDYAYAHADNTLNGPLTRVSINGGLAEANVPLKQYALYFQDDWRVNNRLTLNLGLRYDLITGYQIDQSKNPNFVKVQAAGAAGQLRGIPGMENVGPRAEGRQGQHPAARRLRVRRARRRPGRHPRRLGHLLRHGLHQRERAVPRGGRDRHWVRLDLQRDQLAKASGIRTAASTRSGSRSPTSPARTR